MHCCLYQSLWWTSELWLSVAYHILCSWRNSYAQNAGGILTVLGRLRFTSAEPVYVRLAVGLANTQSVSNFLVPSLNGILRRFFSPSVRAYSNTVNSTANDGVAEWPLEKTRRLGADSEAAEGAGSHES